MDTVLLIVLGMVVCAAGCAIALIWPSSWQLARAPSPRDQAGGAGVGASGDGAAGCGGDGGAGCG